MKSYNVALDDYYGVMDVEDMPRTVVREQTVDTDRLTPQEKKPQMKVPRALSEDVKAVVGQWRTILRQLQAPASVYAGQGRLVNEENGNLAVYFDDDMAYSYVKKKEAEIMALIEEAIGKHVDIHVKKNETGFSGNDIFPDLEELIKMPIEIE